MKQAGNGQPGGSTPSSKKKLSYKEAREHEGLEVRISEAEALVSSKQAQLESTEVNTEPKRLQSALDELEKAQRAVDELYARWAELEAKIG